MTKEHSEIIIEGKSFEFMIVSFFLSIKFQLLKEPKSLDTEIDIDQASAWDLPGHAPPSYDETECLSKSNKIHEKTDVEYPEPLEGNEWPKTTGRLKSVEVDENGLEIIKMLKNGWGAEFFGYLAMIR